MSGWILWTSDLSVGLDDVDLQHKELIARFNSFGNAIWEGQGKNLVGQLLKFLAEYTVVHFADEERLMISTNYPKFREHSIVHREFVDEVTAFINNYEAGEVDSNLVVSVVDKLGKWTTEHIKGMDKEMGEYVRTIKGTSTTKK